MTDPDRKVGWPEMMFEVGHVPNKILTLGLYLVIVSNFLLGLIIVNVPLQMNINESLQKLILISYFLIYYLLVMIGAIYYLRHFKKFYDKNKLKILIIGLGLGIIIGFVISINTINLTNTLSWFIPALISYIFIYVERFTKSVIEQKKS